MKARHILLLGIGLTAGGALAVFLAARDARDPALDLGARPSSPPWPTTVPDDPLMPDGTRRDATAAEPSV